MSEAGQSHENFVRAPSNMPWASATRQDISRVEPSDQCEQPTIIEWRTSQGIKLPVVRADADLWFSQKTLSMLFSVTPQGVSINLRDLAETGLLPFAKNFVLEQYEGKRKIKRRIRHFAFQVAHAIAIRSQHFDQLNDLVALAESSTLLRPLYRIVPVKERNFADLLVGALKDLAEVLPQYPVAPYFVDFFLPGPRIVVEYDERHHKFPSHQKRDAVRQRYVEQKLQAKFIRVPQGAEVSGLNAVLREVFTSRQSA